MSNRATPVDERPRIDHLVTEDDTPVDNLPSEKQQRLLVEPLYASWSGPGEGRTFLAASNVGVFSSTHRPPIVPDVLLYLDVEVAEDWWAKEHRSYFLWEFGKAPDVVVEVVSNREGGEAGEKRRQYEWMRVAYYAIFDPLHQVQAEDLVVYELEGSGYKRRTDAWLPNVGLGLRLWEGTYEHKHDVWVRWCTRDGAVIPTGAERAEGAEKRAEAAEDRAARMAARLRELGIDPDEA